MTCMSASTKASKFGLQVSFQSLWSSLGGPNLRRLPTRSFMFTYIVKIAQGD